MNSLRAKLLVATPLLPDPNFHRTVILLIEHNEEGALGIVLNRPRLVGGAEAVPHWGDLLRPPGFLHEGGPVSEDSVIGVALGPDDGADGLAPLFGSVGILDLHRQPDEVPGVEAVRLFAGYAGWTGGQLEDELAYGSWFILEAEYDDALTDDPEGLWERVLARQEGLLGRVADYPEDPSVN